MVRLVNQMTRFPAITPYFIDCTHVRPTSTPKFLDTATKNRKMFNSLNVLVVPAPGREIHLMVANGYGSYHDSFIMWEMVDGWRSTLSKIWEWRMSTVSACYYAGGQRFSNIPELVCDSLSLEKFRIPMSSISTSTIRLLECWVPQSACLNYWGVQYS